GVEGGEGGGEGGVGGGGNGAGVALWRAVWGAASSRRDSSRTRASNSAAACRPPVRSKAACTARNASGSRRITPASTTGRPSRGRWRAQQTRTASSEALPHTPQLDVG